MAHFPSFYAITSALLIIIHVIHYLTPIIAAPHSSLITELPGFSGNFPSKHYSGYVIIDEHKAKHMFYYFVESERNPAKDPLVLWLNGGPGCSSLGGFIYEHGPFNFDLSGVKNSENFLKLHLNPYSWSKVSSIIYLDSPVGTGFSFSQNTSDYTTGDLKTASDTHQFLLKWFKMFPERIHNPFFISGESYAGVYVPTLASEILQGLDSGLRPIINLKGYLIGNGVINDYNIQQFAKVHFAHGMGLISTNLYQEIVETCHGEYSTTFSKKCESILQKFRHLTKGIDETNILAPCYVFYYDYDKGYRCYWCVANKSNISISCHDDMAKNLWINSKIVRQAIHAAEERKIGKWDMCTNRLNYQGDIGSMIKYHKELISKGMRVLIYSGDHDMLVPYTESESWIRSLGYKITDEWRPWISNAQVAGFTQGYDNNLTFLTVKGAGHMVPLDKPREALDFYSRWLTGKRI